MNNDATISRVMRIVLSVLSIVLLSSRPCLAQEIPAPGGPPLAFTHVTVVDGTGTPAQPDMTVVVSGARITALGRFGSVPVPAGAHVVNATGKFMIPGMADMHTHAFIRSRKSFPLYVMSLFLANGVTTVRDFGNIGLRDDFGDFPYKQDVGWRQAITAGAVLGPRLHMALTVVNGPRADGYPRTWTTVSDAAQAREPVVRLQQDGADFIKAYDQLSRDEYFALAEEATRQGLPFVGHVPIAVTAAEASTAGQRSLEHNYGVLLGASTLEAELMQKEGALYGRGKGAMRGILGLADVKALVNSYSEEKARALFATFVKNDTYVTPTLVRASVQKPGPNDPRVKYFSPALRDYTFPARPASAPGPNPEVVETEALMFGYHQRLVKAMQASGVKMLIGTDNSFFGSAVHDELAELVKAGLTPLEALQIGTRNAATYLGKGDSLGTVETGKLADLVLLDANPLAAIENAKKIAAVVVNGRLLERRELDRLLAQVESASQSTR